MRNSRRNQIWCGLGIVLLGLAVRWPHLRQSLWYDEMTTLVEYVLQPWSKIVAAKAGEYVPNNHVMHTILAKLICNDSGPVNEMMLRLPALAAGVLVPIALAWPLRNSNPLLAIFVALVSCLHPWLVDFSVQARGYSLLLLLGIAATNLLPGNSRGWSVRYALVLALAIYTVPLAVLLVPAHGGTVVLLRRPAMKAWLKGAGIALLLAAILYLPMYRGLLSYYRHPYEPTMSYRQFLNALPRCAMAGVSIPGSPAIFWALPVIAIVLGSVLGWSRAALRPLLLTFGIATILGILLPLISPAATEVRFVPWILPWFCVAVAGALSSPGARWGVIGSITGYAALFTWQIWQDVTLLPQQPIREGIQLADKIVPPGRDIMVLYLGARESVGLYGQTTHHLLAAPDTATMVAMEKKSLAETGHLPWVIIFYERLAKHRDFGPPEARGLWTSLTTLYDLDRRLPGRSTPVAIYRPEVENSAKEAR